MNLTSLEAYKAEADTLVFAGLGVTFDPIQDEIWFMAKRQKFDPDSSALIKKGLNVAGQVGVRLTGSAPQTVNIDLLAADVPVTLLDRALVFDLKTKQSGKVRTLASGVLMLIDTVNQGAT